MELTADSLGGRLREAREKKEFSRRDVIEAYNQLPDIKRRLHEVTLYRYEKGELKPPERTLERLAEVIGVEVRALVPQGPIDRQLKVAEANFPDTAFFGAVAHRNKFKNAFGGGPDLDTEVRTTPWTSTLESLVKSGADEEGVDIALYNIADYHRVIAEEGPKAEEIKAKVVPLKEAEIVEYRGYALLVTPELMKPKDGKSEPWLEFNHYYLVSDERGDEERIREALRETFKPMMSNGKLPRIYVAEGSDMQTVLVDLLKVLDDPKEGHDSRYERKLVSLLDQITESKLNVSQAFSLFLRHFIDERPGREGRPDTPEHLTRLEGPAVFIGSLSQRLIAEQLGARALLDHHDLLKVSGLNREEFAGHFSPRNGVFVNREAYKLAGDKVGIIRARWNQAVDNVMDGSNDIKWIGDWFYGVMDKYLNEDRIIETIEEIILSKGERVSAVRDIGKGYFDKILAWELLQFRHWR